LTVDGRTGRPARGQAATGRPPGDAPLPPPAGAPLRLLRRIISLLPRGRYRAASLFTGRLRRPFVDVVAPYRLGVRLTIDPREEHQLLMWLGAYQPTVVHFLTRTIRPGDTVLCAGLQLGYVAALARTLAGPTGRVVTAEPDPVARGIARRNLSLTDDDRHAPVHVFEGGLSDADGEMTLNASEVLGQSSFAAPHHPRGTVTVPVRRGDDWLRSLGVDHIDVMVLDVEGWELHVLRGLEATLANSPRLVALVEVAGWALREAGDSASALLDFWRHRGYDLRQAQTWGDEHEYGVAGPVPDPAAPLDGDVLCVPTARVGRPAR
jgi:FkbM family methyltransferase